MEQAQHYDLLVPTDYQALRGAAEDARKRREKLSLILKESLDGTRRFSYKANLDGTRLGMEWRSGLLRSSGQRDFETVFEVFEGFDDKAEPVVTALTTPSAAWHFSSTQGKYRAKVPGISPWSDRTYLAENLPAGIPDDINVQATVNLFKQQVLEADFSHYPILVSPQLAQAA